MTRMTQLASDRRKNEIAEAVKRKKLRNDMRLGLPFDTHEGRKRQKGILESLKS